MITIIILAVFLMGLFLILFPTASNYWNVLHQSGVMVEYAQNAGELAHEDYEEILWEAHAYNEKLFLDGEIASLHEEYLTRLDISGQGIMGFVDIPGIGCRLPIYHGTEEGGFAGCGGSQ